MPKRILDPLVLGPIAALVIVWFFMKMEFDIIGIAVRVIATLFLIGFAFSSWLESDPSESTVSASREWSNKLFMFGFGLGVVGLAIGMGYAAFVLVPQEKNTPWQIQIFFQGLYVLFFGAVLISSVIYILKKLKGEIRVKLESNEIVLGEKIHGAVQLKLKKNVEVERVRATLIGYRLVRQNNTTIQEVKYEEKTDLPFEAGSMVGERNFAAFAFGTDKQEIVDLVTGGQATNWKIQANLECAGLDLEGTTYFQLLSPDEVEYETHQTNEENTEMDKSRETAV